jgi:hypothetical protein
LSNIRSENGSYLLLGSCIQELFGHLPFVKDQIQNDSICFYDIGEKITKMEVMHFGMMFLTDDDELHCIQEYAAPHVA